MKIFCNLLREEIDKSSCADCGAHACEGFEVRSSWVIDFFDALNDFKAPNGEVMQILTDGQARIVKRLRDAYQMEVVYEELEIKITDKNCPTGNGPLGRKEVLRAIVDAVFDYEAKKDRTAELLKTKQEEIAEITAKLIKLLTSYEALRENGLVDSEAEYPKTLLTDLESLQSAMHLPVTALHPWTAEALRREASPSAFVRSFLASVYCLRGMTLPEDFRPSDALIVVVTKAALALNETKTKAWAGQIKREFEAEKRKNSA